MSDSLANPAEPIGAGERRAHPSAADALLALLVGLGALALYLATPITRGYGDGPNLVLLFADPEHLRLPYNHALYLPLARLLASILAALGVESSPAETLRLYSQLGASLGVGCGFLVARAFGAGRGASLTAAALFAVAPPVWFYACVPEVHAPHFGAVTFVATVTLFVPWRHPLFAGLITLLLLPVLFLTHQTGMFLFPGWLLLIAHARRQVAEPFATRTLFVRLTPLLAAGFALALVLNASLREIPLVDSLTRSSQTVAVHRGPVLEGLWTGWLKPLAILWLPLLTALFTLRMRPVLQSRGAALVILIAPSALFFLAWGVPERGGYTLGSGAFLIALAALGLDRWRSMFGAGSARALIALSTAVALVLAEAGLARVEIDRFDDPTVNQLMRERVDAAHVAFGETELPKILVSFDATNQTITAVAPDILEIKLRVGLIQAAKKGETPEQFANNAVELIRIKGEQAVVVLDRSYAELLTVESDIVRILREFEAVLLEHFEHSDFPGAGGGFWRLTPRDSVLGAAQVDQEQEQHEAADGE